MVQVPSDPPLQVTGVVDVVPVKAGGCVMVTLVCAVQPFASVTVKLNVPAVRVKLPVPVKEGVPPVAVTFTDVLPPKHNMGEAMLEAAISWSG